MDYEEAGFQDYRTDKCETNSASKRGVCVGEGGVFQEQWIKTEMMCS